MIDTNRLIEDAKQLGIELLPGEAEMLDRYCEIMIDTNRSFNLTALTDPRDIEIKHLLDSLYLADIEELGGSVIDVGTGAGFPGIVIAAHRSDCSVTMIDSTRKKIDFVRDTAKTVGLNNITAIHTRAEQLAAEAGRESYDCAVARAVANLAALAEFCLPLVKVGGCFVSMKTDDSELAAAEKAIKILGGKKERIFKAKLPDGSSRCLILIRKISQTPSKYPRKSGNIVKNPIK